MRAAALFALLLSGAIFGFFYAWVCSTMWGLDRLPPDVAIQAMQGMNGSVRNIVFAPAFFGTGPALLLAAVLCWRGGAVQSAQFLAAAAVAYLTGGLTLTLLVNVPMNEALALIDPQRTDAAEIWAAYSGRWQVWNVTRTVMSGVALLLTGIALLQIDRAVRPAPK